MFFVSSSPPFLSVPPRSVSRRERRRQLAAGITTHREPSLAANPLFLTTHPQQMPNAYQPESQLFCVRALYIPKDPSNLNVRAGGNVGGKILYRHRSTLACILCSPSPQCAHTNTQQPPPLHNHTHTRHIPCLPHLLTICRRVSPSSTLPATAPPLAPSSAAPAAARQKAPAAGEGPSPCPSSHSLRSCPQTAAAAAGVVLLAPASCVLGPGFWRGSTWQETRTFSAIIGWWLLVSWSEGGEERGTTELGYAPAG